MGLYQQFKAKSNAASRSSTLLRRDLTLNFHTAAAIVLADPKKVVKKSPAVPQKKRRKKADSDKDKGEEGGVKGNGDVEGESLKRKSTKGKGAEGAENADEDTDGGYTKAGEGASAKGVEGAEEGGDGGGTGKKDNMADGCGGQSTEPGTEKKKSKKRAKKDLPIEANGWRQWEDDNGQK